MASKNDPKRFWRDINSTVPKNKNKPNHINLVNYNNEDISSEKVSQYINEFFTTIGPKLATKYPEKWY